LNLSSSVFLKSINAKQLGTQQHSQTQAEYQCENSTAVAESFVDAVRRVHVQMAQTRNQMVQIGPNQGQCHQADEPSGVKPDANVESGLEFGKGNLGGNRFVKKPNDEGQQQKHQGATDAVQYGHPTSGGQTVRRQVRKSVDIAKFWLVVDGFCHRVSFLALGHVLVNIIGGVSEPVNFFILLQCTKMNTNPA
jgi:hypothetical protein